jgi:hypothetical protein
MTPSDWCDVERVYAAGIATGHATKMAQPGGTWRDVLLLERRSLLNV